MKKILFILVTAIIVSSCATGNLFTSKEKRLEDQEMVRNAIESRKFIVKFEQHYPAFGGVINLYPRYNYIVVDGEKAIINAAYFGRQYDVRPIAGFNMRGKTLEYEEQSNPEKGMYRINMEVGNGKTKFEVDLSITQDGYCTASISNIKTDFVRYRGYVEPIREKDKEEIPIDDNTLVYNY